MAKEIPKGHSLDPDTEALVARLVCDCFERMRDDGEVDVDQYLAQLPSDEAKRLFSSSLTISLLMKAAFAKP
jgi:hypothetical protein